MEESHRFRHVFAKLVRELPESAVIWQCTTRNYTVAELATEIDVGSETGLQYVNDVMRVCRDFLKHSVKKGENGGL